MDARINETLKEVGLDDEEVMIYLYTLQHGPSTQQQLAKTTGLLRQTIYDRVQRLEAKGILARVNDLGRPLFAAVPPRIFLEQLKEKEQKVRDVMPIFEQLANMAAGQTTSMSFSGLKALKQLVQLTLVSKEEICWIANKKNHDDIFQGHFWHNYAARRSERKIPIKLLIEPTKETDWKTDEKDKRFTKMHDFVKRKDSSLVIFGNQVILYTAKEGIYHGLHIRDNSLAAFFRSFFVMLWSDAKEL